MITNGETKQHPEWIDQTIEKIKRIDLSKLPIEISIHYFIVSPKNNKYSKRWALKVIIYMLVNDRVSGTYIRLHNSMHGIYLYNSKYVEDILFEDLKRLINHEVRECFQIKNNKENIIIFDPHKNIMSSWSAFFKINSFAQYPSLISYLWENGKSLIISLLKLIFNN